MVAGPLVKHLLRYLHATIEWGWFYPSSKHLQACSDKVPLNMILSTDSAHCGEEKMRSTSGWAVQLYGCLITSGSKLQATAVESTCAAELVAACMGENACMKLKDIIFEMTGRLVSAELLVDNQSALGKLNHPAGGNMWLDLNWRVVHQRHMDKLICIRYIPTAEQVAATFTKSLTPIKHKGPSPCWECTVPCRRLLSMPPSRRVRLAGVQAPLKQHTCIYQGAKGCVVCKEFYAGFQLI